MAVRIVILGCGRVGSTLARMLDAEGHEVTIIDQNADQFRRLGPDFRGTALIGNGIDEDTLRRAGIETADAFAATTNGDNTNIMTAQMAKHLFHVPRVIARLYDPIREETYRLLGLETFSPTTVGAKMMREMIVKAGVSDSTPRQGGS
jgi:trk system potassium uptake protein TrkA